MSKLPLTGAGPSGGIAYLLRATFNAANQGYADAQVLDTVAEGIQDGQLTVVEVDGTLAIVSNKCAFTAQGTPGWGDQGFYSQAITRALGRGLLVTLNMNAVGPQVIPGGWWDNGDIILTNRVYHFSTGGAGQLYTAVFDGAGVLLEAPTTGTIGAATDYQLAIVLGGYDVNGVPWRNGQPAANYLYGAAFFIKGGAFTNWTLLWRTSQMNTATLYAAFCNYDAAGTIDEVKVPDKDLSAVLQPTCLSTFTAANGTSLDAITPEVGGAWTEQNTDWEIQSNEATPAAAPGAPYGIATVSTDISDAVIDVVAQQQVGGTGVGGGLALRYSDNDNFWKVIGVDAVNEFRIIERNAASETTRASTAVTINRPSTHDIRAIAYGQTIDGFFDGGNKITYGSAALNESATVHGIFSRGGNYVRLDNFGVFARTSSTYDTTLDAV